MHPPVDVAGRPRLGWLLSLPSLAGSVRSAETGGHAGGSAEPARILLVEDDDAIAEMYSLQLRMDGYAVETARDAAAAFDRIECGEPHVVLLDLLLPGRGGLDVLGDIRARWPELVVVVLSNYGDPDLIARARALGAHDYLVKSRTTPNQVSRAVRGWLDSPGS